MSNYCSTLEKHFFKNVEKMELMGDFREESEECGLIEMLSKWLAAVGHMRGPILERSFSDIAQEISVHWFTWHMARLYWCWGIEWGCRRSQSGPSIEDRDISNDLYDIEYVAYLCRADGILTRDERLVKPLAQAAFPEKDVFSSLHEVPEDYVCHWT